MKFTPAQEALRKNHGTPAQFAVSVYKAVPCDISMDEARTAIVKYCKEWNKAGKPEPLCAKCDRTDEKQPETRAKR